MPEHRSPTRRGPIAVARVAMLAAACLLLGAPAAQAAPNDPVFAAINRATLRKQITPVQAVQLRAIWAGSARAARSAPSRGRRANVAAVRAYTASLARSGGLTGARLAPALLSVHATSWAMRSRAAFPAHEEEIEVPGEVVAFTYYAGRGVQFQPFETFKQGLRELNQDEPDIAAARAIADRLLELDVRRGSSTTWEYYFPFGGPSRPWTSAISQATATEFFVRVALLLPEDQRAPYLDAAARANLSFLRSTSAGGVAVPQGKGSFYVMYPFAPGQRILNGHLQVLLNVNRYAQLSGSPEAREVVARGTRGVLPMLPRFDSGAWSFYLPGQEADLGYHEFQTSQLVRLGKETGNATFEQFGARFASYLETAPNLTLRSSRWPSIIPARDGFRDRVVVPFTVDKRSRVTMVVRDLLGREQWRGSWWGGRGRGAIAWDGRTASGKVAADDSYVATLTSTDVAGNRALDELPTMLTVTRDQIAPTLRLMTLRESGGTGIVTANAFDAGSAWIHASILVDGRTVASRRGPRAGTITLRTSRPLSELTTGQLVLRDSSGNAYTYEL